MYLLRVKNKKNYTFTRIGKESDILYFAKEIYKNTEIDVFIETKVREETFTHEYYCTVKV